MAPPSRGRPKKLARRVAFRQPRRTLLVYCEGRRTEPEYLCAVKLLPEVRDVAAVDIRIEAARGGTPLALVSLAVEARGRAIEEEGELDEIWCVFDVEWPSNHPNLRQAADLASRNGVRLAISNPCFEFWLALHFTDCGQWLDNDGARRLRRRFDGRDDKGLPVDQYMPRRQDAIRRAIMLERRHKSNGVTFPDDNPSSSMFRLLEAVGG